MTAARTSWRGWVLSAAVAIACACGSDLPARYVIERDVGSFRYRRYQKTLGVEFVVPDNPAQGHTATYLLRSGARVSVATAFVTVYTRAPALAAEVRERLQALSRYRLTVQELGGDHAWVLDGGPDERWAVWVSGRYVIKLGAPVGERFPEGLVDEYMAAYPSDLDEHGRALPDARSRGRSISEREQAEQDERGLPRHLRENAPR